MYDLSGSYTDTDDAIILKQLVSRILQRHPLGRTMKLYLM